MPALEDVISVGVVRLDEAARLPTYMSEGAAGLDVCACLVEPRTIMPGARLLVGTGLAIGVPPGHEVQVRPRSGLANKHGITVLNSPGTIDSDYRGEVKVLLINHGEEPFVVQHGERIAQLVLARTSRMVFAEVQSVAELGETVRGAGGYGSTGR